MGTTTLLPSNFLISSFDGSANKILVGYQFSGSKVMKYSPLLLVYFHSQAINFYAHIVLPNEMCAKTVK